MTTNYPTSIDTFVNPTSNDSLNSPSHSQQHANLNDAMVAVQTKLGVGNAHKVALYHVLSYTITGTPSAVVINNCFSSTYDAYRVVLTNGSLTSSAAFHWQLTNGGSPSSAGYSYGIAAMDYAANAFSYIRGQNTSQIISGMSVTAGGTVSTSMDILNPYNTAPTHFIGINYVGDQAGYGGMGAGYHSGLAAYDGLRISASTGTIGTTKIAVYGYRLS